MKTTFDGDELKVSLDKVERDWVRKIRNITRELGRYHPHATAAADALSKVLPLIKDDGEFTAARPVEAGDTNVVDPSACQTSTTAASVKDTGASTAVAKAGGR